MESSSALLQDARAWPFEEARKILASIKGKVPKKGYVLFQTGYGPSGLPHIGTFGEIVRTSMVRKAFSEISDIPTRLFAFSDDMDGLRKVPDNVPNKDLLRKYLDMPLTAVPDPFGTHDSFGDHNNQQLQNFLDRFGFDYEFKSATECYSSGIFDAALLEILKNYEEVINVVLPTLGEERRLTYSPFLPLCEKTGKVLQVPIVNRNINRGTITYLNNEGSDIEVPVTGGHCKLQWKCDWAMRWKALEVDYEMSGKDLIDSVRLSSRICRVLGGIPPKGFTYELFLDENGEKISKSRGNGLTVEDWLRYAPDESLQLYMYNSPRKAKRLCFDVIPKHVDDYLAVLDKFADAEDCNMYENPAWHIHAGSPPARESKLSYSLLLNLVSACNTEDPQVLWGFISRYDINVNPETAPILSRLAEHAITYYKDFVKPLKSYRSPEGIETKALEDFATTLNTLPPHPDANLIQKVIFEVGKRNGYENMRDWFKALYQILLGCEQGPRMGSFIELYGVGETISLINMALSGKTLSTK